MIKNFEQYLLESENSDNLLINFFASLTRNYETQRPFYTDLLQFVIEEERRDWRETRKYVELEKSITHEARYLTRFKMDEKNYFLEINFDFTFIGKAERDAPEAMAQDDEERLNIVLEGVNIKKIKIKSTSYDIFKSGKEITPPVKKACEAFLVKMLENDYDTLGEEIYRIEHS
jgi:hypothetical protein